MNSKPTRRIASSATWLKNRHVLLLCYLVAFSLALTCFIVSFKHVTNLLSLEDAVSVETSADELLLQELADDPRLEAVDFEALREYIRNVRHIDDNLDESDDVFESLEAPAWKYSEHAQQVNDRHVRAAPSEMDTVEYESSTEESREHNHAVSEDATSSGDAQAHDITESPDKTVNSGTKIGEGKGDSNSQDVSQEQSLPEVENEKHDAKPENRSVMQQLLSRALKSLNPTVNAPDMSLKDFIKAKLFGARTPVNTGNTELPVGPNKDKVKRFVQEKPPSDKNINNGLKELLSNTLMKDIKLPENNPDMTVQEFVDAMLSETKTPVNTVQSATNTNKTEIHVPHNDMRIARGQKVHVIQPLQVQEKQPSVINDVKTESIQNIRDLTDTDQPVENVAHVHLPMPEGQNVVEIKPLQVQEKQPSVPSANNVNPEPIESNRYITNTDQLEENVAQVHLPIPKDQNVVETKPHVQEKLPELYAEPSQVDHEAPAQVSNQQMKTSVLHLSNSEPKVKDDQNPQEQLDSDDQPKEENEIVEKLKAAMPLPFHSKIEGILTTHVSGRAPQGTRSNGLKSGLPSAGLNGPEVPKAFQAKLTDTISRSLGKRLSENTAIEGIDEPKPVLVPVIENSHQSVSENKLAVNDIVVPQAFKAKLSAIQSQSNMEKLGLLQSTAFEGTDVPEAVRAPVLKSVHVPAEHENTQVHGSENDAINVPVEMNAA